MAKKKKVEGMDLVHVCPVCGTCPCCGRQLAPLVVPSIPYVFPNPYAPYYPPYVPYVGDGPWHPGSGTMICGTSSSGSDMQSYN